LIRFIIEQLMMIDRLVSLHSALLVYWFTGLLVYWFASCELDQFPFLISTFCKKLPNHQSVQQQQQQQQQQQPSGAQNMKIRRILVLVFTVLPSTAGRRRRRRSVLRSAGRQAATLSFLLDF